MRACLSQNNLSRLVVLPTLLLAFSVTSGRITKSASSASSFLTVVVLPYLLFLLFAIIYLLYFC